MCASNGLLTIISAFLLHLLAGSNFTWGSIHLYVATYLKHNGSNEHMSFNDCFFLFPLALFFSRLFAGIGGYMERKLGPRIALLIGVGITVLSYVVLYVTRSLILYYIVVSFSGIGVGIIYMPPLRTAWKYYPESKGFITGLVVAGFGFSSMIFNLLSDYIINPEDSQYDKNTNFYSKAVGDRVQYYYLLCISVYSIIGLFCIAIISSPKEEDYNGITERKFSFLKESIIEYPFYKDTNTNDDKEPLIFALKSRKFWLLNFMGFCFIFYPLTIVNLARNFGNLEIDISTIKITMILLPAFTGGSPILLGALLDVCQFKTLFYCLIILGVGLSASIGFILHSPVLYVILCAVSASLLGGSYALLPTLTEKIFGMKNASELYGVQAIFFGVSALFGSIFAKFVIRENIKGDYQIVFLVGTFLMLVSLICLYVFSEKKYNYEKAIQRKLYMEKTTQESPDSINKLPTARNTFITVT